MKRSHITSTTSVQRNQINRIDHTGDTARGTRRHESKDKVTRKGYNIFSSYQSCKKKKILAGIYIKKITLHYSHRNFFY